MKKSLIIHNGNIDAGKVMAPIWDEFSPLNSRKEYHAFLFNIIQRFGQKNRLNNKNIRILDTCVGSGIDAILLAKAGYTVCANEFDKNYRKVAEKRFSQEGIKIKVSDYDWSELNKYNPKNLFEIVLCMGNSICYVFDNNLQTDIITNFKKLTANNGLLIIDERNFQFMLDHQSEILNNKNEAIVKHKGLDRHTFYGGEKYFPYPIGITDKLITMGLWQKGKNMPISRFYFYPFKRGELLEMLKKIFGKENVDVYSDYQKKYRNDAGFYQYVCKNSPSKQCMK